MDSLVFLCARRLVSYESDFRRTLSTLPNELYPVLFSAAFLDSRTLVVRDLVAVWPFPVLSFQRLLANLDHHLQHHPKGVPRKLCVQATILAVVAHLHQTLEEPDRGARRCCLRVLDMMDLPDDEARGGPEGMSLWSSTVALAKACLEVSKHQNEHLKHGSKRWKGPSGALEAPQPFGVEIRTDLFVNSTSFAVLRDALQANATCLLRLRCRDFHAEELSVGSTVTLLDCLDACGVRRIDLRFNNLGLSGLCVVLPHLTRFPNLLSLRLPYSNVDVRRFVSGTDASLRRLAGQLGSLLRLKELNFGSSRLSGNLQYLLSDLQTPLESLELAFCSLLPEDLNYLRQSLHAPALRKLDLSGHDFTEALLQPLRQLLETISASLLHLDLMECRLTDSQLDELLPAICRCSQLRCLGLFGNLFSTPALKVLLEKTTVLPYLRLVIYPYPMDCYITNHLRPPSGSGWFFEDAVDRARFTAAKAEFCKLLVKLGRADAVWTTSLPRHGALDYFDL
ncbi:leucine-rich repeat-containing protein 14 [Dryobates pubescens]|uniref:leucine-rich repeat-containing protein 14 n=1 Tax=Dryobates pubescens TaxID=118200 RepID=UPI0023BA301F|nr:leucine-rich repeat-containing protein 14 [Dryobates pubescens]